MAHHSEDIDKTVDGEAIYHDANLCVDEIQGGFGSASLRECLGRIPQLATSSATLGDSMSPHHTNPPQVMSPSPDQTQPQNPASMHDPPPVDTNQQPKRECKEEVSTPEPEQFDVKEVPEEEGEESFVDRPSSDPMHIPYMQDTSDGPSEAPWIWAMSELRSTQHDIEIPRSRVDGVEALRDIRELHDGQVALTTRVASVEESLRASHVSEFTRRIVFIEERIGFGGGVVTENIRECQVRLKQFAAGLEDLRDRMRNQDWYHDLSDQQSSDEIHQMVDGRPMPSPAPRSRPAAQARVLRDFEALLAQLRQDTEAQKMDDEDTIRQRITHFLAEYQRREVNRQGAIEDKDLINSDTSFKVPMTESAMSFNRISQELQGQEHRHEHLCRVMNNHVLGKLEEYHQQFARANEWMADVTRETDRRSHDLV